MREADRDVEHPAVAGGELDRDMLAEQGRGAAEVHRDVEDAPAQHAHQLGLGMRRALEMQAAHRAGLVGAGPVVLHELLRDAERGEVAPAVGLGKGPAGVREAPHLQEQRSRQWERAGGHISHTRCLQGRCRSNFWEHFVHPCFHDRYRGDRKLTQTLNNLLAIPFRSCNR